MFDAVNRRSFLGLSVSTVMLTRASAHWVAGPRDLTAPPAPLDQFPKQDPSLVLEMVSVSHNNVTRVRELIARQPGLAKVSIDWGFGDWETPIDAAAHVGNRDIAEVLLQAGARPTIFSAAMLGHLAVVKAFVELSPGIQRTLGPHSLTLLSHAKAGGAPAQLVVQYLEALGDANPVLPVVPLPAGDRDTFVGTYAFGSETGQQLVIGVTGETIFAERAGVSRRTIRYVGNNEFRPAGGEAVRLRFTVVNGKSVSVSVFAPELLVEARRTTP